MKNDTWKITFVLVTAVMLIGAMDVSATSNPLPTTAIAALEDLGSVVTAPISPQTYSDQAAKTKVAVDRFTAASCEAVDGQYTSRLMTQRLATAPMTLCTTIRRALNYHLFALIYSRDDIIALVGLYEKDGTLSGQWEADLVAGLSMYGEKGLIPGLPRGSAQTLAADSSLPRCPCAFAGELTHRLQEWAIKMTTQARRLNQ